MQIFYLCVVRNDILAYLLPNCTNQLLIPCVISHHPLISVRQSVVCGLWEFIYFHFHIFIRTRMLLSKRVDRKTKKTLHANILLLYSNIRKGP